MSSTLQAAIITLVTSVASVAVGFGLFTSADAQIVVSAIGPIVGSIASIVLAIENNGKMLALVAKAAKK